MSRASIKTKLSLANWAKIFGMHPLTFMQVKVQTDPHCDHIYFQHEWQTADHVSREEIARAIAEAEIQIENALGYRLAPTWEVDEWTPTIRPFRPELVNFNSTDVRGYRQIVQANWGYFITGGIEAKELLGTEAIVWSDVDSDGYSETGTVTATGAVSNASEVSLFYPGHNGDDAWEIRPIEVNVVGNAITITFRRELAIAEILYDQLLTDEAADGFEDDDFLEEVDVYRVYNDPQSQVGFLWEPLANGCSSCGGSGCGSCSYATQTGCLIVRGDPRQSMVGYAPAEWSNDTDEFSLVPWAVGRQPDIVRLYYYSGWRNKRLPYTNRMDPEWERVVAHMAAANLDRPPCDCAKGDWSRWREDLALLPVGDTRAISKFAPDILDNPFGSRLGQVEAWRKVVSLRKLTSVSL